MQENMHNRLPLLIFILHTEQNMICVYNSKFEVNRNGHVQSDTYNLRQTCQSNHLNYKNI